jgi:hypothetical protein
MNVSVDFPPEIETSLKRRAAAAGQDVATYVKEAVVERLAEEEPQPEKLSPREGFAQRLAEWVALFPVLDHSIDDSRESFYERRGE